jgi:hypothetical protein
MPMEARVAYVLSQVASMNAELAGMQLANRLDQDCDRRLTYEPSDFYDLPNKYQLGCNTILQYLMDGN